MAITTKQQQCGIPSSVCSLIIPLLQRGCHIRQENNLFLFSLRHREGGVQLLYFLQQTELQQIDIGFELAVPSESCLHREHLQGPEWRFLGRPPSFCFIPLRSQHFLYKSFRELYLSLQLWDIEHWDCQSAVILSDLSVGGFLECKIDFLQRKT